MRGLSSLERLDEDSRLFAVYEQSSRKYREVESKAGGIAVQV
jgi:hypothetical protein